jgi:hypothetical protein
LIVASLIDGGISITSFIILSTRALYLSVVARCRCVGKACGVPPLVEQP